MKPTPTANDNNNITKWNVDISEFDGRGKFHAVCRETGLEIIDRDPEHTICHALHLAGCDDGPVQFWRKSQKSMTFKSLAWGAEHRIQEGDVGGLRLVKRRKVPSIAAEGLEQSRNGPKAVRGAA